MFIHHVLFYLNQPDNITDRDALVEGLKTMTALNGVKLAHIGKVADTDREVINRTYSISWLLIFDDQAAQDAYQNDPIHHVFIKNCAHLWKTVVIYDSVDA